MLQQLGQLIIIANIFLFPQGVEVLEQQLKTQGKKVNPRIYCQLGHFHLLLEDFSKGMLIIV